MISAVQAGWDDILGIEIDQEYVRQGRGEDRVVEEWDDPDAQKENRHSRSRPFPFGLTRDSFPGSNSTGRASSTASRFCQVPAYSRPHYSENWSEEQMIPVIPARASGLRATIRRSSPIAGFGRTWATRKVRSTIYWCLTMWRNRRGPGPRQVPEGSAQHGCHQMGFMGYGSDHSPWSAGKVSGVLQNLLACKRVPGQVHQRSGRF